MKISRRILSVFLSVVIIIAAIPVSVSSAQTENAVSVPNLSFGGVVGENCYNTDDSLTKADGLDGKGTEKEPFLINTRGDLKYFADEVNSGNQTYNADGVYVKLTVNIDLGNSEWTPIGCKAPYLGNFDGDNHEVVNFTLTGSYADVNSQPNYVGFFGYIKNAEIKNFGVYQYTLNYDYVYDSTVGAMVAYSENSAVTDCYANGSMKADFKGANPLYRSDVIVYTPSNNLEVPAIITADNENGQGVILDFRNVPTFYQKTHIEIGGDVTALKIIGNPKAFNDDFSITVSDHSDFDFYLELVDILMIAPENTDAIKVEGGRNIQILVTSEQKRASEIYGGKATSDKASGMAINAPGSTVVLSGDVVACFYGGNGIDGANGVDGANEGRDGIAGSDGNYAVKAKEIYIDNTAGNLYIVGGNGGNGGNGGVGVAGTDKTGYCANAFNTYGSCAGATGGTGGAGGAGGNGGNGAAALLADLVSITNNGLVYITAGNGGNGGVGGAGGKGGRGQNGAHGWVSVGFEYGHAGGVGGTGGKGGVGGNGGFGGKDISSDIFVVDASSELWIVYSLNGNGGAGGKGGTGGPGGTGGNSVDNWLYGHRNGGNGGKGGTGGAGGNGGDGLIVGATGAPGTGGTGGAKGCSHKSDGGTGATNSNKEVVAGSTDGYIKATGEEFYTSEEKISTVVDLYFSYSEITIGGFIGEADVNSVLTRCASGVMYLNVNSVFSRNPVYQGKFAGKNSGTVDCSAAADYTDGGYTLSKDSFGQQNGTVVEGEISPLSNSKDTQGVLYGVENIEYENAHNTRILRECTVEKSSNLSGEIVIPDYVFEGRAISAVTKITDSAFKDCKYISKIHLGSLVRTIGKGILQGCSSLTEITIGKNLEAIPEYNSGEQVFGLTKSGKLTGTYQLAAYEVEEGNLYFADIDGVLFAAQYIEAFDKKVEICVIDAPACKIFSSDYVLPELVVKIAPFAFAYSNITGVDLNYIREVGDYAFLNASLLKTVRFAETDDSNNQSMEDYFENNQVFYSQLIGTEAFANCTSLETVNLDSAFIQKIGDRAFLSCGDNIKTVTIGRNVKAIGSNAFGSSDDSNYPTKFENYDVHSDNKKYLSIDGVLYERLQDNTLKLLHYPILKSGDFTIPETDDNGEAVSVSVIEGYAFHKSEKLYSADINLTGIGEIGDYAFANSQLKNITIGEGVNSIGFSVTDGETSVFSFCSNLESITVDDSNAYYADINGILFDKGITQLIRYPAGKNEKTYKAPDTVAEVWDNAFFETRYLTFVTFSSRLTRLGSNPFDRSSNLVGIYFKDCYTPLSFGQDPFKTGNKSTVVYYTSGYYEDTASARGWNLFENTYTISEYVPPFLQQDKTPLFYTIAVMNEKGMPIDDVLVSLIDSHSNLDASHTVDGVRVFADTYDEKYDVGFDIDFNTAYKLRITDESGVYFGYENSEFYLDQAMGITYITLSSVPTVSGISVSYRCKKPEDISGDMWAGGQADTNFTFIQGAYYTADINSEVAKVNTEIVEAFTVKVGCTSDTGSSIKDYRLLQGDKELYDYSGTAIPHGKDGYGALTFELKTSNLATEKDIIAEVTFVDEKGIETVISEKLNIQVLKLELYALDLSWATNEIKLVIDSDIPFIGGAELSLSELNKSKVNIAAGPDYFRVLIGDFGNDDIKLDNEYFESNYDRHWGQIFTKDKDRRLWESDNVDKIGLTVGGYIEIKYKGIDAEGKPDFDLNSSITGNLKYTYADGVTRTIWVIPVRLEYKLELGAEVTFKLSYDFDSNSLYAPNLQFKVDGSFTAYAGIGCKLASAGVYGNVTSMMLWDVAPSFELNKWSLKGDLGAYVKYNGLFLKFEKKWSLFEQLKWNSEWIIYNKEWINETTDGWGNKTVAKTYAVAVADYYSQENYSVATSEDAGDYGGIEPKLIQLDDTNILLVYADNCADETGYDEYNYQKLVYQVYNTETNTYSKPQIIDDIRDDDGKGYADGMFALYSNQNGVYLAFTQLTKRLDAKDSDDIEGYVSALEVKTAVWNSEEAKFENISFVSDNECYDTALTMGEVNGAPAVVWIENGENDITGITKNNNMSIICSRFNGTAWETYTVANNLPSVTDLEVYDGTIAYITDENNDLFTVEANGVTKEGYNDRTIVTMDFNGTVLTVSKTKDAYHDISVLGDSLVYYCSNNLYDLETGVALFEEAVAQLPESYTVLTDENGVLKGVLYTDNMTYDSENGENGSNVFGIFCDDGVWGKPIRLTDYGKGYYVSAFDAVSVDGRLMLSTLVTQISEEQNSGNESDLVTANEFKTEIMDYPTGYFTEKPEFVYEEIAPDSDLAVSIPIFNNGIETLYAEDIALSLSGVGEITEILGLYSVVGTLLSNGLPSGAEGELRIVYHTSSVGSAEPTITVGEDEYQLELWYSDLAVSAKQVWLNGMPYLAVSAYNLGLVAAMSDFSVSIDGDSFYSAKTKELTKGDREHFLIRINPELLKGEAGMITVSLGIDGEYMLGNNTATVTFNSDENIPLGEIVYDVNGDGVTDIRDLVRLKKIMAGAEEENRECDVNFDGVLSSIDLGVLRKMFIVGIFDIKQILEL